MTNFDGFALKMIRLKRRIKQIQLAQQLGISQPRLCLIENGYAMPRDNEFNRIRELLDLKPSEVKAITGDRK